MRFDAGLGYDLLLSIHSNRGGCICFINRDTSVMHRATLVSLATLALRSL